VLSAYTLFAALAAATAFVLSLILLRKSGWEIWQAVLLYLCCAFAFLVGARLLNFAVNHENYGDFSIASASFGHFSVYGGLVLACVPAVLIAKVWHKSFWMMADNMVFSFIAAFAIMRVGCFLNGCCYGKVCDVFWGVRLPASLAQIHEGVNSLLPSFVRNEDTLLVYPTQLMEMGLALLFLPLGVWLYKKYRGRGAVISAFVIWFAVLRLFVLYFRELPYSDTVINYIYPAVYIVCILTGVLLLLYNLRRNGTQKEV
jgi:phosphatidylglycerol:prolipoprotein diacylglycerol transferase